MLVPGEGNLSVFVALRSMVPLVTSDVLSCWALLGFSCAKCYYKVYFDTLVSQLS